MQSRRREEQTQRNKDRTRTQFLVWARRTQAMQRTVSRPGVYPVQSSPVGVPGRQKAMPMAGLGRLHTTQKQKSKPCGVSQEPEELHRLHADSSRCTVGWRALLRKNLQENVRISPRLPTRGSCVPALPCLDPFQFRLPQSRLDFFPCKCANVSCH